MGHSHHFLSRLDRVSLPQVELALSLYRDVGLLRYVLERARLPEGASRVAIALEESERGPFIIVTREGRFVTCLGEGMSVDDIPILTRSRLDAIAARGTDLRARLEACKTRTGSRGGAGQMLTRVHEAGDELSREMLKFFGWTKLKCWAEAGSPGRPAFRRTVRGHPWGRPGRSRRAKA